MEKMDYDDAMLQRQYFWKFPIRPCSKLHLSARGSPQRSHSPQSPSSTPRPPRSPGSLAPPGSPMSHFPTSPVRSEAVSPPRNLILMGTSLLPDHGTKIQVRSNLLILCREKASRLFFLAFIDIIYETQWGKLPAPIFEIYTLHLHDNYLIYEFGSIRKFMGQYRSIDPARGITIHGMATLAPDYLHTPELLAPQIFALDLDLADPSAAINRIYYNQILVHRDPQPSSSAIASDLELLQKLIQELDLMFRYHRGIKNELKSQIRAACAVMHHERAERALESK